MPKRVRTGLTGHYHNPPGGFPFIDAIGKLIINFGALEFQSYIWIAELARDDTLLDLAVDMSFSRRVALISQLIDRERMPRRWKNEATKRWDQAQQLAQKRNIVAHSPIVIAWKGRPAEGPPDIVAIPKLKYLKREYKRQLPTTPLQEVLKAVDEIVPVAEGVTTLLEELRSRMDARRRRTRQNPPRGTAKD